MTGVYAQMRKMKPPKLLEKDVVKQVRRYLELRGWRALRMHSIGTQNLATGQYVPVGEPGMPDHLFVWYLPAGAGGALLLWIEFKGPGDRRKCSCKPLDEKPCGVCRQALWRTREEQRGGLVWQIDDLRVFEESYERRFGWLHGEQGPKAGQTFMQFSTGEEGVAGES